MKRIILITGLFLTLMFVFLIKTDPVYAVNYENMQKNYRVKILIDNENNELELKPGYGAPFIVQSRTFVPYRLVGEALNAQINWDESQKKITAILDNNKVEMVIGDKRVFMNGQKKTMDVEPFIMKSERRVYIPIRYLTEGLNYKIEAVNASYGRIYIVIFTQGQDRRQINYVIGAIKKKYACTGKEGPVYLKDGLDDEEIAKLQDWAEAGAYSNERNDVCRLDWAVYYRYDEIKSYYEPCMYRFWEPCLSWTWKYELIIDPRLVGEIIYEDGSREVYWYVIQVVTGNMYEMKLEGGKVLRPYMMFNVDHERCTPIPLEEVQQKIKEEAEKTANEELRNETYKESQAKMYYKEFQEGINEELEEKIDDEIQQEINEELEEEIDEEFQEEMNDDSLFN